VYEGLAVSVEWLTAALTLTLVGLVSANVVARYAFNTGFAWVEELSRLCFVWMVFLGAYVALRRGAHLAIHALVDRLPRVARLVAITVGQLVMAAFLVVLVEGAASLVHESFAFGTLTPVLGISTGWSYLPIAVAGVLMLCEVVRQLAQTVGQLRGQESLGTGESQVVAG
jgi:TRAP-type C4-dicarboxylate transport system permease small subunit